MREFEEEGDSELKIHEQTIIHMRSYIDHQDRF